MTPELNILPLLSLLPAATLPPSVDITSLDLVLGGLLSPGSSLLNGISATISGLPVSLTGPRGRAHWFLDRAGPGHRDGTRLQLPNSSHGHG